MKCEEDTNHEGGEADEGHESDERSANGLSPFRFIRVPSPLSHVEEEILHRVIGCAIAVHRGLGPGFLESIYRRAMCVELERQRLDYEPELAVRIRYYDTDVGEHRIDLVVQRLVVVELKSIVAVERVHRAQVISYLRSTRLRAGLLLNFRVARMKEGITRIVL